mmetsp:Transcript_6282/g.13784  ORF Transcript_6282/g.13784 Transcript_6282/m.13784 type:complete len:129 (+) Transcript_6282:76-462(+)
MASWHTGLFDCCGQPGGPSLCLLATCCPCIVAGDICEYLQEESKSTVCMLWVILSFLVCAQIPFIDLPARRQIAKEAEIENDNSCCKACCFSCCSLIQVRNQVTMLQNQATLIEEQQGPQAAGAAYPP